MLTRIFQAAAILLAGTTTLAAQTAYPSRPITMVVAFNAGGSTDLIARVLAARMGSLLGQTVIIENKGGADGAIGTAAVARAMPDGYTIILSTTSTHVINPLLNKNITYNPATGATMHLLNAAMFKSMANLIWVDVPYKGSGPALNDLISGQVDLMFDQLPSSLAQVQGGRLKAVAVTSRTRTRTSVAPDIPTIAESGLPAFEATSWWAVFAPPKTPPEIVDRLNAVIHQALADSKLLATFTDMGLEVWRSTPAELSQLLVDERMKWQKVIVDNNIEVN